jgi:4'-phosphopantetheinyl transferase
MNLYLQNVATLPDPKENEGLLAGIPTWRKTKMLRYLRAQDRKLCYGAWLLLQKTLELNGASASDVTVGENGKLQCPDLQFSISHSADYALCVVGNNPIGCDIEKVEKAPFEVAEHYFKDKEREYISEAEGAEKSRRFFKLWTLKESYLKMTGEGLGVSPNRIEVDFNNFVIFRDGVPQFCKVQNFSFNGYEISTCEKL